MSILSSIKPQPWPLSPALTEAPELWRGVEVLFPLWPDRGLFFFNNESRHTTVWNSISRINSSIGAGVGFEGTDSVLDTGVTRKFEKGFSCFVVIQLDIFSSAEKYRNIFSQGGVFTSGTPWAFGIRQDDANSKTGIFTFANNGSPIGKDTGDVFSVQGELGATGTAGNYGTPVAVGVSWVGDTIKWYLNGKKITQLSITYPNVTPSSGNTIRLGGPSAYAGSDDSWDNRVLFAVAKNGEYTDEDHKRLYEDPFAMLRPRSDL